MCVRWVWARANTQRAARQGGRALEWSRRKKHHGESRRRQKRRQQLSIVISAVPIFGQSFLLLRDQFKRAQTTSFAFLSLD